MPDNVMTGKVAVAAPGVDAVFGKVASATLKTNDALKKIPATTSAATQSLINLSRVAQDAPYGFIGIANNINPLLESFQRLRASTNSTGSAFKAFAGQLIGPGGLGLAVGVLSSLLVVFSGHSKQAKEDTEKLNIATENAKREQEAFQAAINSSANALIKDAKNLTDLKAILEATTQANIKLTDETIKRGLAGFIFSQKESELQKVLSAEIEKQFLLRKRLANIQTPFAGTKSFAVEEPILRELKAQRAANQEFGRADVQLNKTINRLEELNEVIGSSGGSIDLLNAMSSGFGKAFQDLIVKPSKVSIDNETPFFFKDSIKPIKIANPIDAIVSFRNVLLGGTNRQETFAEKFQATLNKSIADLVIAPNFKISTRGFASDSIIKAAEDLAATFNSALSSAFADGFSAIGEGIGNLLAGNDFGKQFSQIFGDLFITVGKALIKFGIVKEGIDKLLKSINLPGAVAIGLGIFAIAAGQLLKATSSGGGRAAGGGVSAGQGYWVGERGKEFFRPNVGGTIEPNNYGGGVTNSGGISVTVGGEFVQRGKDLVAVITLQTQSNNRLI